MIFLCCWGSIVLKGQSITSVTTSSNPVYAGGTSLRVTISGSNTNFTTGSTTFATVTSNLGQLYTSIDHSVTTSTNLEILTYIPCGVCGSVDLSVTTAADGQLFYNNAFQVVCPQLNPLQPNTGAAGQSLSVGISGTNLNFTQGSQLWISLYNPSSNEYLQPSQYTIENADSATVNLNIPTNTCGGTFDLTVSGSNACFTSLPNAFTITGSTQGQITQVNPDTIQVGQTLPVGISGTSMNFTQGSITVFFRDAQTGRAFYPNSLPIVHNTDSFTVSFTPPSGMCEGDYDVCVRNSNTCLSCLDSALYVVNSTPPISITGVTTNPAPPIPGAPLEVTISGTNLSFLAGSNTYFNLVSNTTGHNVGTYNQRPNPANPNEIIASFNYLPVACGSFDLDVYQYNGCNNSTINYPNAVVVNSFLNPIIYSAVPVPSTTSGQLKLRLAGTDIDFSQGSSTLTARLVHPTNGTVIPAQSISSLWTSSWGLVEFTVPSTVCGDFILEFNNVSTGCGGTTTITYSRLVSVNALNCHTPTNTSPGGHTPAGGDTHSQSPLQAGGSKVTTSTEEANLLNQADLNKALQVKVFPNPMQQYTNILIQGEGQTNMTFVLYDLLGQVVQQKEIVTNETLTLQREQLPAGMYLYQVLDATGASLQVGKLEMQ